MIQGRNRDVFCGRGYGLVSENLWTIVDGNFLSTEIGHVKNEKMPPIKRLGAFRMLLRK